MGGSSRMGGGLWEGSPSRGFAIRQPEGGHYDGPDYNGPGAQSPWSPIGKPAEQSGGTGISRYSQSWAGGQDGPSGSAHDIYSQEQQRFINQHREAQQTNAWKRVRSLQDARTPFDDEYGGVDTEGLTALGALPILAALYQKQSDSANIGLDTWDPKYKEDWSRQTPEAQNPYGQMRIKK